MEHPVTAVYDANVLYPAPLRDLLIRLAQAELVKAKWTDTIHDEWMRNVLKNRTDLTAAQLMRTKSLMDCAVRDCLVRGYESLIDLLELPDPDDRHVVAAAIHSRADLIVTYNLRDFPADILSDHGIEAIHPDALLSDLFDVATASVLTTVKRQRNALRNPARTAEELIATFENQGLTQFAA